MEDKKEELVKFNISDENDGGESVEYQLNKELADAIAKFEKKNKKSSDYEINRVCYSTGFVSLDLMLGKNIPSKVEPDKMIKNRGLRDGVHFTIGGRTHMGKSVFAMNVAGNVVRPFIEKGLPAWIEYFASEEGLEQGWMMACAGLGNDAIEKGFIKITHRHRIHTSTEGLFRLVKRLYELKTGSPETFQYETTDMYGRPIKKYVPTVLVCDSWTMVRPEALEIKDEASNTYHARKNNINGMFLEQMRPLMLEANIMFFAIVHVGEKIGMDARYTPREYATLAKNMSVSGGKIFHFETEFGIVLNKFVHDGAEAVEECLGIPCPDSKTIGCVVYKSRFAMHDSSSKFNIVFDPDFGFNPLRSLYVDMLLDHLIFENAGAYKYLKGYPDDKFYKKDFFPKFIEDVDFRKRASVVFAEDFERYTRYVDNKNEVHKTSQLLSDIF